MDGSIPKPYLTWFYDALNDPSSDINECLSIIVQKEFQPTKNTEVNRAISTLRYRRVQYLCERSGTAIQADGEPPISATNISLDLLLDNPARLSEEVIHMIEECICADVDGKCVLKTLDGHGIKLTSITHSSDELT